MTEDPIDNMPPQLQAANRKRRAKAGIGNPPRQPDSVAAATNVERSTFPTTEELLARIETLEQERRSSQFVPATPEGKPQVREAADEELTPWLRELRHQTRPTPQDFGGDVERPYNHRQRFFVKPDGSVVSLQGSPQARAYYTDKGFRMLTDQEAKYWLEVERPKVVAQQQQKAHLITTLRRTVQLDPSLKAALDPSWDGDLSMMTIEELQGQLDWIAGQPTADGRPRRVLERLPRLQDADSQRAEAEAKRMLEGVETNESTATSQEDFLDRVSRGRQSRNIPVTAANVNQFR